MPPWLVGPYSTWPQHTLQSTYNQYIKPSNCLIGPLVGLEKVNFRSQILVRPSIGEYWNTFGVPVLPENVIFTFFRMCWCYSETYNTGTQKWFSIVQCSCTSIWDFKYTFSVGFHLNLHKNKNKQSLAGKRSRIFAHAIANFFLVNARRSIDYKRLFTHTCIRFGAITKASLWLDILLIQQFD